MLQFYKINTVVNMVAGSNHPLESGFECEGLKWWWGCWYLAPSRRQPSKLHSNRSTAASLEERLLPLLPTSPPFVAAAAYYQCLHCAESGF